MSVVDDGRETANAATMQCPRVLILSASAMSALWFNGQSEAASEPFGLDSKGSAENSQNGMIGVQRSVDGGSEKSFWSEMCSLLISDRSIPVNTGSMYLENML